MTIRTVMVLTGLLLAGLPQIQAGTVRFPENAGVLNVRDAYNARGDGKTDDTAAIQKAITENVRGGRVLYFPDGTYLISSSLSYGDNPAGLTLQGQSQSGTVIRLTDNCAEFQNAEEGRPVLNMLDRPADAPVFGAAFRLFVRNLTIDTGRGNPGAVGMRHIGNNGGGVSDVTIRSGDPQKVGVAGIRFDRRGSGPALFSRITVEGFDYGVQAVNKHYCHVFEHLTLRHQRIAGMRIEQDPVTVRNLISDNAVPVLVADAQDKVPQRRAHVVIIDGKFTGGSTANPAIRNGAHVMLRNVEASGYGKLVESLHRDTPDYEPLMTKEYVSDVAHSLFPSRLQTLNLPVKETPVPPDDAPENWIRVEGQRIETEFVERRNRNVVKVYDGSEALQAAIDKATEAGRTTVYFPNLSKSGENTKYYLSHPVTIRGSVRRIVGLEADVEVGLPIRDRKGGVVLKIDPSLKGQTIWIEGIGFNPIGEGRAFPFTLIDHASEATLVLRDLGFPASYAYKASGNSEVFIENCAGSDWVFAPGQRVWARQYNTEGGDVQTIAQDADLWILGLKTEQEGVAIKATGGRVEVLGGFLTPSHRVIPPDRPAFDFIDAQATVSVEFSGMFGRHTQYHNLVREKRGDQTRLLPLRDLPRKYPDGSGTLQLYSSSSGTPAANEDGFIRWEYWEAMSEPLSVADRSAWSAAPVGGSYPSSFVTPWLNPSFMYAPAPGLTERLRGALVAPQDGAYRFIIQHAGASGRPPRHAMALWVNPDAPIASGAKPFFLIDQTDNADMQTPEITLRKGQQLHFEMIVRRSESNRMLLVGWSLPDGKLEMPIPPTRLSAPVATGK